MWFGDRESGRKDEETRCNCYESQNGGTRCDVDVALAAVARVLSVVLGPGKQTHKRRQGAKRRAGQGSEGRSSEGSRVTSGGTRGTSTQPETRCDTSRWQRWPGSE